MGDAFKRARSGPARMSSCTGCGRPLDPRATFCTACGATAPPRAALPPSLAGGVPGAAPAGPVGKVQEAWVPPVLTLVTLAVYEYVWAWRVTREVDAWRGSGEAHEAVRRGVAFGLVGSLVFAGALAALLVTAGAAFDPVDGFAGDPFAGMDPTRALILGLAMLIGFVLMMAGMVWFYIGLWRVWRVLEAEAVRRGAPAFSPSLMLVLVLVPYVNLVGTFYVLWRTQKELNAVWAPAAPPAPRAWRA